MLIKLNEYFNVAIKKYVVWQCDAKKKWYFSVNTCYQKNYMMLKLYLRDKYIPKLKYHVTFMCSDDKLLSLCLCLSHTVF